MTKTGMNPKVDVYLSKAKNVAGRIAETENAPS